MRVTSLITDTKGGVTFKASAQYEGLKCHSLNNFMVWSECARDSHVPTR